MATWLVNIKGIGAILAGGIVAYFDVAKTKHISSMWKYAGLSVENGKAIRRKRGKKLEYSPRVKVLMWKVADSFIKQRTPFYRDIYDNAKESENLKLGNPIENPKNCPHYAECMKRLKKAKIPACKMHIHLRAIRKMIKYFLGDYWLFARKIEGLSVTEPYGHKAMASEKPKVPKRAIIE